MSDATDMTTVDLEDLIAADADEGLDAAAEAGLTGDDEESSDEIRDSLSELAAGTGDDEADDRAEEEPEDDDEEDDTEAPEDEELEADPDEDPEPDERDEELAKLKALIQEERAERHKLEVKFQQQQGQQQQQGASPQQQQPSQPDPQFATAVKALMLGGDPDKQKEVLGRLPPHVVDGAARFVRDSNDRWVAYEMQPELRYRDQFQHLVAQQIQDAIKPYQTDRLRGQAQDALAPYRDLLASPEDRDAIKLLLDDFPDGDLQKRVKYAVEIHLGRKNSKRVAKKSRQLDDKGRDLKAQKASRRRGGKRSKRGRKALPEMDTFNAAEYAARIEGMEIDPSEYEDMISG